jgi:hypothetical protein
MVSKILPVLWAVLICAVIIAMPLFTSFYPVVSAFEDIFFAESISIKLKSDFNGTLHFCQKVVNSSNSKHKHPSGFPDIFLKTSLENG